MGACDEQRSEMARHSGRLELTWTDKDKALLSAGDGRYDYTFVDPGDRRVAEVRLLHEVESIGAPDGRPEHSALPTPTTDNLLITGDAMHVLDSLAKIPEYADKYLRQVKLVYIDPPFNTGQTFDNYEDNIAHSIWLTMLRDRLRQIKPLLAPDASVWVHLDNKEAHRCRVVMDEELGATNFVESIAWEKAQGAKNDTDISSAHDHIWIYAKDKSTFKRTRNLLVRSLAQIARYQNPDQDPRGPWRQGDNGTAKSGSDESNRFPITVPSGREVVPPLGSYWRFTPQNFEQARQEGRVWFGQDGDGLPLIKRYLSDVQEGVVPRTWWPAKEVGSNQEAKRDHLRKMFPDMAPFSTPKPERLLQRIIHIATNPGDIVLDCFAGSGSTAAVAHKMGRRWVTSELRPETVESFTKPRLSIVVNGADPRGITSHTERVPADGVDLPESVSANDAQEFLTTLGRVLDRDDVDESHKPTISVALVTELAKVVRAAAKQGNSRIDAQETRALLALLKKFGTADLDITKAAKSQLSKLTQTKDVTTTNWYGGGGFTHLTVGPSMFEEVSGMVLLADWATNGDLGRAMCAQLEVRYAPEGIFAGRSGRRRLVVIDGLVGPGTIDAVVDQLVDRENAEIWATQVVEGAESRLKELRSGSRLNRIPEAVLDTYRRKAPDYSPFGGRKDEETI